MVIERSSLKFESLEFLVEWTSNQDRMDGNRTLSSSASSPDPARVVLANFQAMRPHRAGHCIETMYSPSLHITTPSTPGDSICQICFASPTACWRYTDWEPISGETRPNFTRIPMKFYATFLWGPGTEKTDYDVSTGGEDSWKGTVKNIGEVHIFTMAEHYARREEEEKLFEGRGEPGVSTTA
ncbi:hypothetical protein JB92DRAFT_2826047 [Gautieria morchelliformis]|nr:hypothetical protein JB92DRAFT_2826047 [Gautieria morchelliformis]